jgi:hypothetical protein
MSKERYNQIIDEVFINYCQTKIEKTSTGEIWISYAGHYGIISKEEFINKCKTDNEFSQEWGLHIEERELTDKERLNTLIQNEQRLIYEKVQSFKNLKRKTIKDCLDEKNIPTKVLTLTYKNETIECYEN